MMKTARLAFVGITTVLVLTALFVKTPYQFAQSTEPNGAYLWIATIGPLLKLDSIDGNIEAQPADAQNQLRIDIDETREVLWSYGRGTLAAFNSAGELLHKSAVPPPASATSNLALAVDSTTGNLWLAIQRRLHQFNSEGKLLRSLDLTAQAQDIAVDADNGILWVATQSTVTAYDQGGALVRSLSLPKNANVQAIAVDRLSGAQWVAFNNSLGLYNSTGTLIVQRAFSGIEHLADDGDHGVWASAGPRLLRFSATQQILVDQMPLGKGAPITALVGDRNDQSIWIGSLKSVLHIGSNGAELLRVVLNSNLNDLALFHPVPPPVPPNQPPVARDDSTSTAHNTQVAITVLGNDNDPDGDNIVISEVTQGTNGSVTHNGTTASYTPNNNFAGEDKFTYTITDGRGGFATATVTVTVNPPPNSPPQPNAGPDQVIALPSNANLSGSAKDDGLPNPPGTLTFTWSVVSGPGTVTFGNANAAATTASFTQPGVYVLSLRADDGALAGSDEVQITVNPAGPPDPAKVAPPIDQTVATNIGKSTEFLYTGANPIQTGVAPGTINPVRAAVLRGKVMTRDGNPLSGVTITVLDHPEFGQTLSRADGMFDMAVNGGGLLTVNYQKDGFLPVQRQVQAPWRDFAIVADAALIPLDPQVTNIALNANVMQVARGTTQTDNDGSRQATLLFPAGTTATMTLPNGTIQPLTTLNVRATEYTVGPNGPKAMPAPLPPTSAYTYAVELSADQAIGAKAKQVTFNQPVINYVENFLNFPVGGAVPTGYYDRQKGLWVPSNNGRVVKILSVSGGLADLDTTGGNVADNGVALGVTTEERQQLASLYSSGQSFWRVPIPHFTPWDHNWPFGPPADAVSPRVSSPREEVVVENGKCLSSSSIIECQNQVLGERVAVTGTQLTLNYKSSRTPGRVTGRAVQIPLSGDTLPASLKRIDLSVSVAGQAHQFSFSPTANQSTAFSWDGKDTYGRTVQGAQPVVGTISYVYDGVYQQPESNRRFGESSEGLIIEGSRTRQEIFIQQPFTVTLGGTWDSRGIGLGGWSLDSHHSYDIHGRRMLLGSGRNRSAQGLGNVISTIAGTGQEAFGCIDDNAVATQTNMNGPNGATVGSDGSLYFSVRDTFNSSHCVHRLGPDGIVGRIAGEGPTGFSGDGGLARRARLRNPSGVAVGLDGSVYIADSGNRRIRRVGPDGIITTVAGGGNPNDGVGDGGLATQASLSSPMGVAIAPDGGFYVADLSRIRRVAPDGIISTVAGGGNPDDRIGDGGPATKAALFSFSIAVHPDGSLYIADVNLSEGRIRRVGPDGIISTVAGGGNPADGIGDGGPATQARLISPIFAAIRPDGSFYIADTAKQHIRFVGPDGIIRTVAGNGEFNVSGDGGLAILAGVGNLTGITTGPDGALYILHGNDNSRPSNQRGGRIRKVDSPLPNFTNAAFAVVSEEGSQLYQFDSSGRHLRTVNTLTTATRYEFGYDTFGRLARITDADGKVTTIERDGSGNPVAIVAPFAQRTTLTVNLNGYLSTMTNPAGEQVAMEYTTDGLLTQFVDPRRNSSHYSYDALGRLTEARDRAGNSQLFVRSPTENGWEVARTTPLGRTTRYRTATVGESLVTNVQLPSGAELQRTNFAGIDAAAFPDGTIVRRQLGPDPRFLMQAPVGQVSITTPGGLVYTAQLSRSVTLTNPRDLLSVTAAEHQVTIDGRTTLLQYDATARRLTYTTPEARQGVLTHDAFGRPVSRTFGGLVPIHYTYRSDGLLDAITWGSGAQARSFTFGYGAAGLVESITDPLGETTRYEHDASGRVTRYVGPDGAARSFSYDMGGNITSITPPGRPAHGFGYGPRSELRTYALPDVGTTPGLTEFLYDRDRRRDRVTRPDGTNLDYLYDAAGRLVGLGAPGGQYAYAYNTGQRLASIASPDGSSLSSAYDGRLLTGSTWSGAVSGSVTRAYDNAFRVTSLAVNGQSVAFSYDRDNLLTRAGELSLSRDGLSGFISTTMIGRVSDTRNYDAFGEVNRYAASVDTGLVYSVDLTRDAVGRIARKVENVAGATTTYDYRYDVAGRLIETKTNGVVTETYTYDENGNRLSGPSATDSYLYDARDRLISHSSASGTAQYAFDANGELASRTASAAVTTYAYGVAGSLRSVMLPDGRQVEYAIDGRHRRIGKKINGTFVKKFLYQDRLKPIAELDANNAVVSRFVYAGGVNVPAYMVKGGATYRIITDGVGSPRLVIDVATGAVAQQLTYDSFGRVIFDSNPGFQPFGFAGGLYDSETGLVRFGYRDYDSDTGRWTAPDPIGFAGGDTNLYAYASGDPINDTDPTGLEQVIPDDEGWGGVVSGNKEKYDKAKSWWDKLKDAKEIKERIDNINKTKNDDSLPTGEKGKEIFKDLLEICKISISYLPGSDDNNFVKDYIDQTIDVALDALETGAASINDYFDNNFNEEMTPVTPPLSGPVGYDQGFTAEDLAEPGETPAARLLHDLENF